MRLLLETQRPQYVSSNFIWFVHYIDTCGSIHKQADQTGQWHLAGRIAI